MKTIALALVIALGAPLALSAAEGDLQEKTREVIQDLKDGTQTAVKAAEKGIREGWAATKEALSKDPAEYKAGASRRLDEIGADITALQTRAKTSAGNRDYVQTHLSALPQHLAYARVQLAAVPDKQGESFDKARASLDRTIGNLESSVSLVSRELDNVD